MMQALFQRLRCGAARQRSIAISAALLSRPLGHRQQAARVIAKIA